MAVSQFAYIEAINSFLGQSGCCCCLAKATFEMCKKLQSFNVILTVKTCSQKMTLRLLSVAFS